MRAFILLLLVWLCDVARSACPNPFVAVGTECFYLSSEVRTWKEAYVECEGLGGYLAVPSSVKALHAFVFPISDTDGVWLGGTDAACKGEWNTYINGHPIDPRDWFNGPPVNQEGKQQHCLEIVKDLRPPLNGTECDIKQQFVCEIDDLCPYEEPKCPFPFVRVGDACYYLGNTSETWNDARFNCLRMGGDLASFGNQQNLEMVLDKLVFPQAITHAVWLGAEKINIPYSFYQWRYLNGSYIYGWGYGEPNPYGYDCLEAREHYNPPLYTNRCYAKQNYVCQTDLPCPCPALRCPSPYTLVGNECFYFRNIKTNWHNTHRYCRSSLEDGLAIPNNVTALKDFLYKDAANSPDTCGVWIGGRYMGYNQWGYNVNTYKGNMYKPINPWDWFEGHPINRDWHCLKLDSAHEPPLVSADCFEGLPFVCEVPVSCPCLDCWPQRLE